MWKNIWNQMYEKMKMENKIQMFLLIVIFSVSLVICTYKWVEYSVDYRESKQIRNEILNIYEDTKDESREVQEKTRIDKLKELQQINSDIIALIEIEGTNINYPVVQTDNNDYYMTHNYKKQKSKDGAIFLDKDYDWNKPSKNLLIYGHNNIGSKEMFVELVKYKNEEFYKKHKVIKLTTAEEKSEFEIISIFLSRVYYNHERNVFRYYYFIDAKNEKEFNSYVNNVKKTSLYSIKTTAEYEDQLMTLSTCEYSQVNGRLVVVARKVMSD